VIYIREIHPIREENQKMKAIILIFMLATLVYSQHGHGTKPATEKPPIWLDTGLGNVEHPVTTKNAEAQKFFNQGLAYMFAFNHAEGINSFRHALELDPELAMAYWGVALGLGSNYNVTADEASLTEAHANLQKAIALAAKASQADRDYIEALTKRYSKDPKADQKVLGANYKAAMADLVKRYPDDLDAATLYAESMMNLRPWQLWSLDGKPAEGTLEIISVLEGVLRRNPNHSGANHYYIHAVEASPSPERGLAAAMRLGGLAPNAGHLVHMPSHIYLRTGDWDEAVKSNDLAIEADRNYQLKSGSKGLYMMMYYNHNIHMLASSHAANGNYAAAMKAANELTVNIGPNVKAMPMLEMFMPYAIIANVRFHKWDEALAYPQPGPEMLITTAHWHFARGMAFAGRKKTAEAEKELAALRATAAEIPAAATLFTTPVNVALKVADDLLLGEIALSKGDRKGAIQMMRNAVLSEGKVNYAEPPDWDVPVREWLGRTLMMDGQYAEAEKVFREEIARVPRNGRALFGLAEALRKQGKEASAALVQKQFESAWNDADTKLDAIALYK
jgi:tetratricopeptide (TPR) repeat protein